MTSGGGTRKGNSQAKVLIAGPPTSGKTCLLGAAHLEANMSAFRSEDIECSIIPRNPEMSALLERARRTVLTGSMDQIGATSVTTMYEFDLRVTSLQQDKPAWLYQPKYRTNTTRFCFLDGPGGTLLPTEKISPDVDQQEIDDFRGILLAHARESMGLLLCVDSSNEELARSFFFKLPTVLADIGTTPLHFKRIAILLTKSDTYFLNHGRDARFETERMNPWARAVELLSEQEIGNILTFIGEDTRLACGWSSAYGFIQDEGTANYDATENRLRTFDPVENQAPVDSWRPFRVLDPFVFLASGYPTSMLEYSKAEMKQRPWL